MFIEVFKNNGIEYLRLAESRRKTNQHGVKVRKKKIILNRSTGCGSNIKRN